MSRKVTLALSVLAVALLAFIVFYEQHTLTSGELEGRKGRLLASFVRERVTRVEVTRKGEERITLERKREEEGELGDWWLVEPVRWGADFDQTDILLGALEWADARRTLRGIAEEDREHFGLSDPQVRVNFTVGEESYVLTIGGPDPQGGGHYAQLDDPSVAYVVGEDLLEALNQDADHFRNKELMRPLGVTRATELRVASDKGSLVIAQQGNRWWATGPYRGYASESAVQRLLQSLDELRAERFIDEEPRELARFGLEAPQVTVTMERAHENEDPVRGVLRLGAPCEGHAEERYARVDEGPVLCVLVSATEGLSLDPEDVRERALLTARDEEIESIVLESGGRRLELKRGEAGWTMAGGDEESSADQETIRSLTRALRQTRATSFREADDVALREAALAPPRFVVTFGLGEEQSETLRFGRIAGEETFARRNEEPAVLVVPAAFRSELSISPVAFRGREVLAESPERLLNLAIEQASGTLRFDRTDGHLGLRSPEGVEVDAAQVQRLVRRLSDLSVERWVSEEPVASHGLAQPSATLTLVYRSGSEDDDGHGHGHDEEDSNEEAEARAEYRLVLGASTEGGAFARLDDGPVFIAGNDLVELLEGLRPSASAAGAP